MNAIVADVLERQAAKAQTEPHSLTLIALFCGVGLVVALIMASMGFDLGAEFSHTIWESRSVFEAWTKSEAFRAAHSRAGDNKPLYLDHPQFEGFEVRQTVGRKNAA